MNPSVCRVENPHPLLDGHVIKESGVSGTLRKISRAVMFILPLSLVSFISSLFKSRCSLQIFFFHPTFFCCSHIYFSSCLCLLSLCLMFFLFLPLPDSILSGVCCEWTSSSLSQSVGACVCCEQCYLSMSGQQQSLKVSGI